MNLKMNSYTHVSNLYHPFKNHSKKKITLINNSLTYLGVMYEKS